MKYLKFVKVVIVELSKIITFDNFIKGQEAILNFEKHISKLLK